MEFNVSTWTTREIDGEETDLLITAVADYSPAAPDVHYLPNGDPGYPGDPESIEFSEIHIEGTEDELSESDLTENELDGLRQDCFEKVQN